MKFAKLLVGIVALCSFCGSSQAEVDTPISKIYDISDAKLAELKNNALGTGPCAQSGECARVIGDYYLNSRGDWPASFYWYQLAAHVGNKKGMYYTGVLLLNHETNPEAQKEGQYWLQKAAEKGDTNAQRRLNQYNEHAQ